MGKSWLHHVILKQIKKAWQLYVWSPRRAVLIPGQGAALLGTIRINKKPQTYSAPK